MANERRGQCSRRCIGRDESHGETGSGFWSKCCGKFCRAIRACLRISKSSSSSGKCPESRSRELENSSGDALPNLECPVNMKRAVVQACLFQLAQRCARRRESSVTRNLRREALLEGRLEPAFRSPKRGVISECPAGSDIKVTRTRLPAMVLPRWESLDNYEANGLHTNKLHLLEVCRGGSSNELEMLACVMCHKATAGGEAIIALPCAHNFCPTCFEVFLRSRWAELVADHVDNPKEMEQVPCPKCGFCLQRHDVLTLTEAEVTQLVARRVHLHGFAGAAEAECLQPSLSRDRTQTWPSGSPVMEGRATAQNVVAAVSKATPVAKIFRCGMPGTSVNQVAPPESSAMSPSLEQTASATSTPQPQDVERFLAAVTDPSSTVGNEAGTGTKPSMDGTTLITPTLASGLSSKSVQSPQSSSLQRSLPSGHRPLRPAGMVSGQQPRVQPLLTNPNSVSIPVYAANTNAQPDPHMQQRQQNANNPSAAFAGIRRSVPADGNRRALNLQSAMSVPRSNPTMTPP